MSGWKNPVGKDLHGAEVLEPTVLLHLPRSSSIRRGTDTHRGCKNRPRSFPASGPSLRLGRGCRCKVARRGTSGGTSGGTLCVLGAASWTMGRMGRVGGRTRSSSCMATETGKRKCEKKRVVWHLRLVPYSYTSCRQRKGGLDNWATLNQVKSVREYKGGNLRFCML
jgi:hypothetical protein